MVDWLGRKATAPRAGKSVGLPCDMRATNGFGVTGLTAAGITRALFVSLNLRIAPESGA